jgi:hypothetical protein
MFKAKCECGKEISEDELVPCCDRCGKAISDSLLDDQVLFMVHPGDEEEGPQFLGVVSCDINGDPDGNHYCKTCTSFLIDQSFIRQMQEENIAATGGTEPGKEETEEEAAVGASRDDSDGGDDGDDEADTE